MLSRRDLCIGAAGFGVTGSAGSAAALQLQNPEYLTIPTPLRAAWQAQHKDNCVLFLRRDMRAAMPSGDLTYWEAKRLAINVRGTPRRGDIAMIPLTSGQYAINGHVTLVYEVTGTSITILEANWRPNQVTMRRATGRNTAAAAAVLNIAGYYRG